MKDKLYNSKKPIILFSICVLVILSIFLYIKNLNIVPRCNGLDSAVTALLKKYSVLEKDLIESSFIKRNIGLVKIKQFKKMYKVGPMFNTKDFEKELETIANKFGFSLIYGQVKQEKNFTLTTLYINLKKIPAYTLILRQMKVKRYKEPLAKILKDLTRAPGKGKVAIVIDDWGYNKNNLSKAIDIHRPITFSILPNLPFSKAISQEANSKGYELILHMPMEPYNLEVKKESVTICTDMKEKEIIELLERSVETVPDVKGISNHMGSKVTENKETMDIIFKWMKKRGLYFLDSMVTEKSICKEYAKNYKIRFAQRDVFLDNQQDADYIKGQLYQLALLAKKNGRAIGIGHDKAVTIQVLKGSIQELENAGVEFVYLSDLVQ